MHYLLGVPFGHFNVTLLRKKIDMTYCLVPMHVLIDELHHLTWIETVSLTKVDKQSFVATLRLTRTTTTGASAFSSHATVLLFRAT